MTTLSMQERKAICLDHGRTVEKVSAVCMGCGRQRNAVHAHSDSDEKIARECFPDWRIKGVAGRRKTLCPKCASAY